MIKITRDNIFVFFFLFSSCVTLGTPSTIEFGDSHLKSIIEETLKKKDPNEIDMLGLESLEVPWATIRSIKGLETALNLKKLDVENNSICSLEPIKNLRHIEELDISGCGASDSDNLVDIKSLKILKASRNHFSDISFLEELKNLETLDLSDNNIADIESLGVLTNLRGLSLDNNMIREISVLAKIKKLTGLTCFANQIQDIAALSQLSEMKNLELGRNEIENIEALSELSQLGGLGLTGNKIKDVSPLRQLKKLELLELGENSIVDISSLSGLAGLRWLALQENMINDISSIEFLKKIEMLNLNGNPLGHDAIEFSLPLIFLRKPDEINIYWSGKKYETDDRELRGKEPIQYSIGPHAEISPDERYLAIVIGPRHSFLSMPDETASVYILDTGSKITQLLRIPYTTGIKFHFGQYPIAWRQGTSLPELYVYTDRFVHSLETPCLKGFSISPNGTSKKIYSRYFEPLNYPGLTNLQWYPNRQMLSGIDSGQMFLLAPDTDKLKRYNMLGREDYIWSDADTLYNNTSACIFKSKIQESGYIQQQRLRTVQTKALLGGVVNNKLVYSIGNRIYYDNELVYTAGDEVKKLFVGDSKIATMFGDQVSIVNFQGATECKMPVQKGTQLLAFAPKTRFLYLLNDYHSIEKINLNVKDDCSIIFNTRQLSGKLKGEIKGV